MRPDARREDSRDHAHRADIERIYALVVAEFRESDRVSVGSGKGFGAGAIKVDGRIFAMLSSKGFFVIKLPKARVDELIAMGIGERFDPGHGRRMKEWPAIKSATVDWANLAKEAFQFVAGKPRTTSRLA